MKAGGRGGPVGDAVTEAKGATNDDAQRLYARMGYVATGEAEAERPRVSGGGGLLPWAATRREVVWDRTTLVVMRKVF